MTPPDDPQALLFAALAKAQAAFPPIARDKTVKVATKTGGSYSFNYAPLDTILAAVRPTLAANDLALTQALDTGTDGRPVLVTMLVHSGGGSTGGRFPLKIDGMSPQEVGSLVSYVRRYAIVAALGIATEEDDDANHATGNTATAASRPGRPNPNGGDGRASEAQVRNIYRLIHKIDVTGDLTETQIIDAIKTEFGIEHVPELSKGQATGLIERLMAKAGEKTKDAVSA